MGATGKRSDRWGGIQIAGLKRATRWACCLLLAWWVAPTLAAASEPKLVVAAQITGEAAAETDFHVRVESATPIPTGSALMITGLPKSVTFSAGKAVTGGVWEVPLPALEGLKMTVPAAGEPSNSNLILFLTITKTDLVILASARSVLIIEASGATTRRQAAAKTEEGRLAEAKRAEDAKRAEEAKAEKARQEAAARKAEEERLAEAKRAEDTRRAEEAKAEKARQEAAARKAEEERLAEAKRAEDARRAEEAKAEKARQEAAARKAEEERLAEAKRAEDARRAEEAKAEKARQEAAARKAEEERLAEAKRAEDARRAQEAKAEKARQEAAARKAEEERLAEAKRAEEVKRAQAAKAEAVLRESKVAADHALAAPQPPPQAPAQPERLVNRGDQYLSQGNIVIARQYFLRAAQAGLAAGAFKLAETHDPHELARLNSQGLLADVAEARRWYARALALGAAEAKARLARLGD